MNKDFDKLIDSIPGEVSRFVDKSDDIAQLILAILSDSGKTQKDLARMLSKSESEISKWLTGRHNFTLKSLAKLEEVLGCDLVKVQKQSDVKFPEVSLTKSITDMLESGNNLRRDQDAREKSDVPFIMAKCA